MHYALFILLLTVWDLSGHHITHCGSDPGLVTLGNLSYCLIVGQEMDISFIIAEQDLLLCPTPFTPRRIDAASLKRVFPSISEALTHTSMAVSYEKLSQNRLIFNLNCVEQNLRKAESVQVHFCPCESHVQQPTPLTFTTPCSIPHSWYLTLKVLLSLHTHTALAGHVRSS